jgi:hypothetical protein
MHDYTVLSNSAIRLTQSITKIYRYIFFCLVYLESKFIIATTKQKHMHLLKNKSNYQLWVTTDFCPPPFDKYIYFFYLKAFNRFLTGLSMRVINRI